MEYIKYALIILAGMIAFAASLEFVESCKTKFNHVFLSKLTFGVAFASTACGIIGKLVLDSASASGTNSKLGMILIGIGGLLFVGLLANNFIQTNFKYGFIASLLQLIVLIPLSLVAVALIVAYVGYMACESVLTGGDGGNGEDTSWANSEDNSASSNYEGSYASYKYN